MGINKRILEERGRSRSGRGYTPSPSGAAGVGVPMVEDFAQVRNYNTAVRRWGGDVEKALGGSVRRLTNKERQFFFKRMRGYKAVKRAEKLRTDELHRNIKKKTRKNGYMGQITSVSFRFPAHGIYLHHGVSRGHPAGNPRKKVDWFNPVLEDKVKGLADIAAEFYADAVVNSGRMLIK